MKTLLRCLSFALLILTLARAAEDKTIAAVRTADDERIAAFVAGDRARLEVILSSDLRYGHSSGNVDGKSSLIDAIVGKRTQYLGITYDERTFSVIAPGVVQMAGRGHFKVNAPGQPNDLFLGFLGVWREENGQWRFVAWQSCRITPPATPGTTK